MKNLLKQKQKQASPSQVILFKTKNRRKKKKKSFFSGQMYFDTWKWINKQRLDGNVWAFLILRIIPACIYIMHSYLITARVYGTNVIRGSSAYGEGFNNAAVHLDVCICSWIQVCVGISSGIWLSGRWMYFITIWLKLGRSKADSVRPYCTLLAHRKNNEESFINYFLKSWFGDWISMHTTRADVTRRVLSQLGCVRLWLCVSSPCISSVSAHWIYWHLMHLAFSVPK